MWNKLFGGGDRLPRAKVDAVVAVIDRYLSEEAELRGLRGEKQSIHPRDYRRLGTHPGRRPEA
jgi:hypothetical protein